MTAVVSGVLICSCGFQIAGVAGWLVRSVIIGWVCCWFGLQICKVFSGSGFVDVVVDDLIRWW